MSQKLVTIIIPVYNREATLVRCLDSIGKQRGIEMFQLVIVDNNSTDKSVDVLTRWRTDNPNINISLINESRQSAAAARNAGLAIADTQYVMFFDSDDEMLQGHLERLLCGISDNPDADVFGWSVLCELPNGKTYLVPFANEKLLYNHMTRAILATQHFAVKTSLIKNAGVWNPNMKGWDDYELGVRLLLQKPRCVYLPDSSEGSLVKTYFSQDSITGSLYSPTPEKWEKALDCIEITLRESCPEALCWVGFRRAVLAGLYAREGAAAEAKRLLATAPCKEFNRKKARLCYEVTRLFGRGARHIASRLLPTEL